MRIVHDPATRQNLGGVREAQRGVARQSIRAGYTTKPRRGPTCGRASPPLPASFRNSPWRNWFPGPSSCPRQGSPSLPSKSSRSTPQFATQLRETISARAKTPDRQSSRPPRSNSCRGASQAARGPLSLSRPAQSQRFGVVARHFDRDFRTSANSVVCCVVKNARLAHLPRAMANNFRYRTMKIGKNAESVVAAARQAQVHSPRAGTDFALGSLW